MLHGMPAPLQLRVFAYAVGVNVPVQELVKSIPLPVVVSDRKHVVCSDDGRYVVAYDFGALVFVGPVGEIEEKVRAAWAALTGNPPRAPTTEDFLIVVDPDAKPDARFDRVVVPALTLAIVEIAAIVVGQSVAMEHLETEIDQILGKLASHAGELAEGGSFRASRRELLRFIGRGMAVGHRAVFTLSILDPPLISWNDELLDRIHTGLTQAFGIGERYRALDHKLTKVQDNLELFVNLIQSRRAMLLELVVVALIALEIILAFFR